MNAAVAYPVPSPNWILTYTGQNITADISSMVLSISYTDHLSSRAGELDIVVEDSSRRWQGAWYPALGDEVNLLIGYQSTPLLPCGDFEIDQLELDGPPDRFRMRCLSAYITPAMRTRNTFIYENQSLLAIATTIAQKYQLQVVGIADSINPVFSRIVQKHESDVEFLNRIATAHDYDFTVRGSQLIFYARAALAAQVPLITLMRSDVERFSFLNRTHQIYKAARLNYFDPETRQLISQSVEAAGIPTGDTIKLIARCDNGQQALLKAQAALDTANLSFIQASLVLPGNIALSAGNTVILSGWGSFDGPYLAVQTEHSLNRKSGYTTRIMMRRVPAG
jgi:phage protein D